MMAVGMGLPVRVYVVMNLIPNERCRPRDSPDVLQPPPGEFCRFWGFDDHWSFHWLRTRAGASGIHPAESSATSNCSQHIDFPYFSLTLVTAGEAFCTMTD